MALLRTTIMVVGRVIIAGATIAALALAMFIGSAIIRLSGHGEMPRILRASLIAAFFVVMAFMMISYLVRKLKLKNNPRD